jgi:transcriptional regulator GlxA family with amidase domain
MNRRHFLRTATAGAIAAASGRSMILQADEPAPAGIDRQTEVVILLYDNMTALDAIGPYEVLRCVPGVRVRFAAKTAGLVRTDAGLQMLNADAALADISQADILIVPGGDARGPIGDPDVLDWIRRIHATSRWTTSVCVGSLILGAAGILKGLKATSHWNAAGDLRYFGAEPAAERFVREGKIMTAAGVSAGLDMALQLVALEFGEAMAKTIQLVIEYDPHPPFQGGSIGTAAPETVNRARLMLRDMYR